MKRKAIEWLIIGIAATVAVSIMANGVILNLNKPLREREDITWQYFLFDNNLKKLINGNLEDLFNTRMFYPRTETLAFGNSMLGQSLMAIPVYLITNNVVTAANSVIFLQLWLAFISMYFLSYLITRNIGGSLIAGMIYSFNPYVMAHLHHEQLALAGLPALFLVAEVMIEKGVTYKRSLIGVGVWTMLLLSSLYYALFATITVPIYGILRWSQKRRPVHWQPLALAVISAGLFAWIYLRPFVAVKQQYEMKRSLALVELLSANPQDFLFTSPENWLYGRFSDAAWRDDFARSHPTEHSLFPGLVALGLAGICVYKRKAGAWGIILALSIILALGPKAGVYRLIYEFVPGAAAVRAVSRFSVLGFMAIGVLAALGWAQINRGRIFLFAVLVAIAIEYYQTDWVKPFTIPQEVRQFYSWLNTQDQVKAIVELPIANDLVNSPNFERSFYDDGQYLLYALWHDKALVNGHHSFIPAEIAATGRKLTIDFPTAEKLDALRQTGVDLIIVHREEYRNAEVGERVIEKLNDLNVPMTYDGDPIKAFRLQ